MLIACAADMSQSSVLPCAAALDTQDCLELGQMLPTPVVPLYTRFWALSLGSQHQVVSGDYYGLPKRAAKHRR